MRPHLLAWTVCAGLGLAPGSASAQEDEARFVSWAFSEVAGKAFVEEQVEEGIEDVEVELIGFPWNQMFQNLVLRHRSGQPTEAAQLQERWVPTLAELGALRDLEEVFEPERLAEAVDPGLLAMGRIDGVQVGVPWTAASIALVANGRVLEAAGIAEPPETMEEFRDALVAIKENVPNSVPFGLSTTNPDLIQVESQILFWQHGARFFDEEGNVAIDSPEAREALSFIVGLVEDGLVAKGNDRNATRNLFAQELVGFYFDPPVARGFARQLTGEGEAYDAAIYPIPTPTIGNDEPPRSVIWAHLLGMMTAGDVNVEAGAEVIEHFALNPETQIAYWEELGMFPTTKEALAQVSDDPYVADWIEIASTALLDEPARFDNSSELRQIIGEEIEAAMLGVKSVDDAITDMAGRLERAL